MVSEQNRTEMFQSIIKRLKGKLLVGILILLSSGAFAQIKNIGVPFIYNYLRASYGASGQNWAITQDNKGFIYFGNNDGVLKYDGSRWSMFPTENLSIVRSVLAVGDTVFVGAFEEIGMLAPDSDSKMTYKSLNHLIPPKYASFDEVWNIFYHKGQLFFQSFEYIFILRDDSIRVIEPISNFGMMFFAGDKFYVVDTETGLMVLHNENLKLVSDNPVFMRNEIRSVNQLRDGRLLIGTSNEGLFTLDNEVLLPWKSEVNLQLRENKLFSVRELSGGYLAFGSVRKGIFITDNEGVILQHLNRFKGLQNNTVLSIFEDHQSNLWLGLDNGIDFIGLRSPISLLNHNFNIESVYTSIIHNGTIYIGTNQGLFAMNYDKLTRTGASESTFTLIEGTEGQVWSLTVIYNTLFAGHNFGCFLVDGFSATKISDIRGFWSFIAPPLTRNLIIAGTYTGLVKLSNSGGRWQPIGEIYGFNESSRSLFMDRLNNIWVSHGYKGLFKLRLNSSFDTVVDMKLMRGEHGLPEQLPYNIQVIDNEMVITTHRGVFKYDYNSHSFKKCDKLTPLFDGKGLIDKLHQDEDGNIWYFTNSYMGVFRLLEDASYRDIQAPFSAINETMIPAFQNLFVADSRNVFVGSQDGLIHYDPSIVKDYRLTENVFINETMFYGGGANMVLHFSDGILDNNSGEVVEVPFSMNSIRFLFSIPSFEYSEEILFSYRLSGFDEKWSEWGSLNIKEYTNLREGDYIFEIKAKNKFNHESSITSFRFTIKPPFIRSRTAFIIYAVIFILFISGNIIYLRKRILMVREKEIQRQKKRLEQREQAYREKSDLSEKEIAYLRNESLKKEMIFKNKELANATMHLIQKNKTLTHLKIDLSKLIRSIPAAKEENQIASNILKRINKDLRSDKQWEVFNTYFDDVHQDFVTRLKHQYPDLTPKELRLCAYLRMNISSKEIAPLMNISTRGVEISRYRLRKKLNLNQDTNLTNFILSF